MNNTDVQEEVAIYRERRVNSYNIVGLYDVEVTKAFLGCARNANCYNIITERIPYRLNDLSGLTFSEAIFIFHESLNGYN